MLLNDLSFTLDQLIVLDAIVLEGGFSAAARHLGRAPSAISYTVKTLEVQLGVPLFDRSGHRAQLTATGRAILEEARGVLARARTMEDAAGQLREGWEPSVYIVLDGVLPMAPVIRSIRRFGERGLPTRVRLHVEYLYGVLERFERDEADLMLALDVVGDAQAILSSLPPLEMRLVIHPSHPLAIGGAVDRDEVAEHVELVVADSSGRPRRGPHRLSLGTQHVFELSDFHSKRLALLEGVGFGWLPEHLVADDLAAGHLIELPFVGGSQYTFAPYLVGQRKRSAGPGVRLLVSLLQEEIADWS